MRQSLLIFMLSAFIQSAICGQALHGSEPCTYCPPLKSLLCDLDRLDESKLKAKYAEFRDADWAQEMIQSKEKSVPKDCDDPWCVLSDLRLVFDTVFVDCPSIAKGVALWFTMEYIGIDTRIEMNPQGGRLLHLRRGKQSFRESWTKGVSYFAVCDIGEYSGRGSISQLDLEPGGSRNTFRLNSAPKIEGPHLQQDVEFVFEGKPITIQYTCNTAQVDFLQGYPAVSYPDYLQGAWSEDLEQSLLPQLDLLMKDLSKEEKVNFLLAFIPALMTYDSSLERRSKAPELTMALRSGDCEQYAILLASIVRRLDLGKVLLVHFENHLTVAVNISGVQGDHLRKGFRKYFFAEATTTGGRSFELGESPRKVEEVLKTFGPF
jgi:hypothetical protein